MVFELISSNGKKMHCLSLLGSYGERNQAKGPSRLSRWELCFPAWWFTLNTSKRTQEWLGVKQGGILHGQRICGLHKAPALVLQITVFFLCWCWSLFRIITFEITYIWSRFGKACLGKMLLIRKIGVTHILVSVSWHKLIIYSFDGDHKTVLEIK